MWEYYVAINNQVIEYLMLGRNRKATKQNVQYDLKFVKKRGRNKKCLSVCTCVCCGYVVCACV